MKLILIHNNYSVSGGAEFFFREVGRVLEQQGHKIAYFCAHEDGTDSPWSEYFVPQVSYRDGKLVLRVAAFPRMVYSQEAKRRLTRLIAEFRPDLVHAFAVYVKLTPSILDACREAGIPVVMSCNDYKHICPNYKLYHRERLCGDCSGGRFYKAAVNRCCHDSFVFSLASSIEAYVHDWMNIYRKNIHTFLFASEFMARETERFWGDDTFRWKMLRNPFNASSYPDASGVDEGYILYFGRLIDEKGVDVLVRAMSRLPHVQLKIVGDGPQAMELQELVRSLRLNNVEFVGPKWGEALQPFLSGCRFVVVPSLWHENFPYVILQAFASGKAVIGSNRGGIPELVSHGERGLVYEAVDAAQLADAIDQLWRSPEQAREMGSAAPRVRIVVTVFCNLKRRRGAESDMRCRGIQKSLSSRS